MRKIHWHRGIDSWFCFNCWSRVDRPHVKNSFNRPTAVREQMIDPRSPLYTALQITCNGADIQPDSTMSHAAQKLGQKQTKIVLYSILTRPQKTTVPPQHPFLLARFCSLWLFPPRNEVYNFWLIAIDQSLRFSMKLQMGTSQWSQNVFNSGADNDPAMKLKIRTQERYCLHLLRGHYCAALRSELQKQSRKCLIASRTPAFWVWLKEVW